ncbi:MAG TPA: hypothetical protein VK689_21525 [Armatimonadota bacterium]|nr:hypothetical protein [Armatimonadota bacterium]
MMMYVQDNDGRFALRESWQDATWPYYKPLEAVEKISVCPSSPAVAPGYAFNSALHGLRKEALLAPEKTPMLFDSSLGRRNGSDHLQSFAPRHRGRANVAYADGRVKPETTAPPATATLGPTGKTGRSGGSAKSEAGEETAR